MGMGVRYLDPEGVGGGGVKGSGSVRALGRLCRVL